MNIALMVAGGKGERMGQDIPKQFLHVENKPIIIYSLEIFQNHPDIDYIIVVCLEGWHEILKAYARQYGISKLDNIISGGYTRHESVYNGLLALKDVADAEDNILIVEGNRPLISNEVISDSIDLCKKFGATISGIPCVDVMLRSDDGKYFCEVVPREVIYRGNPPESVKYGKALEIYEKANKAGITNQPLMGLMVMFGEKVILSKGSTKNIKITTVDDIEIFKALLRVKKDDYLR